jgi:hypothetical protein
MAFPVILVNSATGSDTAASGAGPSTAITGTSGSFSGAVVTLDGSPSLAGVATDGSHAIYILTSTGPRFFEITAKDDSAKTVSVTPNPSGTATGRTWAIGGKRASVLSASSLYLLDAAGSAGDAKAGWVIQMESGHTETQSTGVNIRAAGTAANGPVILQGEPNAATMPAMTATHNGYGFTVQAAAIRFVFKDFAYNNSSGTKTAAKAIRCFSGGVSIEGMRMNDATDKWLVAVYLETAGNSVTHCDFDVTNDGVEVINGDGHLVAFNKIKAGAIGIKATSDVLSFLIDSNIVYQCGAAGISFTGGTSALANRRISVIRNILWDNTGSGIVIGGSTSMVQNSAIFGNILSENGGYGLDYTDGAVTANFMAYHRPFVESNAFYANTSGDTNPAGIGLSEIALSADPFVDAAAGDFNINDTAGGGAALRAATVVLP